MNPPLDHTWIVENLKPGVWIVSKPSIENIHEYSKDQSLSKCMDILSNLNEVELLQYATRVVNEGDYKYGSWYIALSYLLFTIHKRESAYKILANVIDEHGVNVQGIINQLYMYYSGVSDFIHKFVESKPEYTGNPAISIFNLGTGFNIITDSITSLVNGFLMK